MRKVLGRCLLVPLFLLSLPARAEESSEPAARTPVGRWRTIDDASGKPKSIVAIWEEHGKLYGKVEELLDPKPDDPDPKCTKCPGDLKDQPIRGLRILWDLRKNGGYYSGGNILDPGNGKTYSCILSLAEDGKKLKVRGFIGVPFLGRNQTWLREE
ncbi:MAG TPA: DUF2147 domain-containing protein [Anaeromyxobacter sp.]|nr:DUF2147 domain-containing protein [Anaeromyxobacter sp.]